jgi:hypothetical protein
MAGSRLLATLLAMALALAPMHGFAQGFEFGEDDVEPVDEGGGDDGGGMEFGEEGGDEGGDDGGMTFGTDEVIEENTDTGTPSVAVVAMPGPNMGPELRGDIQSEMMDVLADVPGYEYRGPETVLPGLEERGLDECVREPICLGAVGTDAGVDRILLARVKPSPSGGQTFEVDFFEVKDKLTLKYAKRENLGGDGAIVDSVKPVLYEVLEVRLRDGENFAGPEDDSIVGPIVAYSTAVLAVGSLIGGIVFGLSASSGEDDLQAQVDAQQLTQEQANDILRDVQSDATTANVFYGLAIGLAAVSGLFFYLDIGSDVGESEDGSALLHDVHIAPAASENGFGFGAGFRF